MGHHRYPESGGTLPLEPFSEQEGGGVEVRTVHVAKKKQTVWVGPPTPTPLFFLFKERNPASCSVSQGSPEGFSVTVTYTDKYVGREKAAGFCPFVVVWWSKRTPQAFRLSEKVLGAGRRPA